MTDSHIRIRIFQTMATCPMCDEQFDPVENENPNDGRMGLFTQSVQCPNCHWPGQVTHLFQTKEWNTEIKKTDTDDPRLTEVEITL